MSTDGCSRRDYLRRVGTTAAAGGVIGAGGSRVAPQLSPVGRARAAPWIPVAIAVGVGARYVAGAYTGDDIEDEYQSAREFEDHLNLYNDAREIAEVTDETLLASLKRDARNLGDAAREDAIIESYHTIVDGGSRDDAEQAMTDAIDARFAEPEKSLATRVNAITEGTMISAYDREVISTRNPDDGTTTEWTEYGPDSDGFGTRLEPYTFLDGSEFDVRTVVRGTTDAKLLWDPFDLTDESSQDYDGHTEVVIQEPNPDDYEDVDPEDYDLGHVEGPQKVVDHNDYVDVLDEIHAEHQAVIDEVDALLDTHYDGIEAGDLSLEEMLSTGAMLDTLEDAESWGEAALYFRTLGLPEAVEPSIVSLESDEFDESDQQEFDGKLAWSLPEEVDGNELPVGTVIDAEQYPGSIYFALEWENDAGETEADVLELTGEFVIEAIESDDEYLEFESRDVVTADTNPDEAADIFRENRESEETARDQTIDVVLDGGGGGSGDDGLSDAVLIGFLAILGAAAAAVGLAGGEN